jgi:catechol 2,3-dioxygenase-like lactoylglutathione lyase family enzyme
VLVAAELEPVVRALQDELGLGEPFADPGVAEFGLRNAVLALGDCFIEVVAPARPGAAAVRQLERHGGDCGYMAMFQVDDLQAARERVSALGVRVVWQIDLPDISGTHLHPSDMRGAIVSLDRPDPPESWRWGGPGWIGRAGEGAPGRLAGITVAVDDPEAIARRWARVLGVEVGRDARPVLRLAGDGEVAFEPAAGGGEGLTEVAVALPPDVRREREEVELGGVVFRLTEDGR